MFGIGFLRLPLSNFSKQVIFQDLGSPAKVEFVYSNSNITLTETMTAQNDRYPISVSWALMPLKSNIENATLYLTTYFDLRWDFNKAQIPQLLDWVNPWDAPAQIRTTSGNDWATAGFSNSSLKDSYIGLYDDKDNIAFAFKFNDLPDWGNIGALTNRQIDAVRFQYQFSLVNANQTVTRSYQVLTLSKSSYPTLRSDDLEGLLSLKVPEFTVETRDYGDYINNNDIGFIVYDRNQLDPQIVHSKILELIYSNDRYVIFKVVNQPQK
jgi:hypothetical protein